MKKHTLLSLSGRTLCVASALMMSAAPVAMAAEYVYDRSETGKLTEDLFITPTAEGNTVTVSGMINQSQISVYAAYSADQSTGVLENNELTILTSALNNLYGAYVGSSAAANNNTVKVTLNLEAEVPLPSSVYGDVYGGFSANGAASNNTVTMLAPDTNGKIYGGASSTGAVTNNAVSLVEVVHYGTGIYGGYTDGAQSVADANTVTMVSVTANFESTTAETAQIVGGYSEYSATGNAVQSHTAHLITSDVYGGIGRTAGAFDNTVTLNSRTLDGNSTNMTCRLSGTVMGGYSVTGNAANNTAVISDYTVEKEIYGGYSQSASATANTVELRLGAIAEAQVYGGYSQADLSYTSDNQVIVTDSVLSNDYTYGGYSEYAANHNSVLLTNSSADGNIYGGVGQINGASHNTVTIRDNSQVNGYIQAGRAYDTGAAQSNTVTVTNSTLNGNAYAGRAAAGAAALNALTITDSTATKNLYGGYATEGNAVENSITVTNSALGENVYAGYSDSGHATGNAVTLKGYANSLTGTNFYGGFSNNAAADMRTGNTLTLDNFRGEVKGVYNMESLRFMIDEWTDSGVILSVANKDFDLSGMNLTLDFNNYTEINALEKITLISGLAAADADWATLTVRNTDVADLSAYLQLQTTFNGESYDLIATAVQLIPAVPEPATATLTLLASLLLLRRRR